MGESGQLDIDMLETGISTSQRSQIANIRAIMKEHDEAGGIPIDKVVELASSRGISKENTKSILQLMKTKGDIYVKREGHYKLA